MIFKRAFIFVFLTYVFLFGRIIFAMPGSATFSMSQRFFSDKKLGEINGFSEWGAFQFDAEFGLYRLPFKIEPLVGIGYIQGSTSAFAVDSNGDRLRDDNGQFLMSSIDRLSYKFITSSLGLRWKAWSPSFFRAIPYIQVLQDFRFGFLQKKTYAVNQEKSLRGFDMGTRIGGGILISFLGSNDKDSDLRSEWNINDFGLLTFAQYLSGGQIRAGLGDLSSLSGWSFGAGFHLTW